jgi:glycosyltransferase involved in cell wall biosynthesis
MLSSFPPTQCGIATFAAALGAALGSHGVDVTAVRAMEAPDGRRTPTVSVVSHLIANVPSSMSSAVSALNHQQVALVQHEYGLYGGLDGSDVVKVLEALSSPSIVTLHTVLAQPTSGQRAVLRDVIDAASHVVVMTEAARQILGQNFSLTADTVSVIPHGAALLRSTHRPRGARPVLLSWGLIGPGKGIEWVIDALPSLRDLSPRPLYVVAGHTHPKVFAATGDVYRQSLERRVVDNGVEDMVVFENAYLDMTELNALIAGASIVVLPYDSTDQGTSGVLVDAVAAGRPVVATSFPHAVELLGSGAGEVVPHRDPAALSAAIRRIISDPRVSMDMMANALHIAPQLSWTSVSWQYLELASQILATTRVDA